MKNKTNIVIGIVVVLVGIIILMWGSYYDGKPLVENAKAFAQALGCSIILAGVFGVVLEWKSTRDYFGKRLSKSAGSEPLNLVIPNSASKPRRRLIRATA
ncbi:hypothetical protein SAMN05216262_102315 [Colwellia chukchiensis]|uniref:Uncharacterized protein n=1 Tax=Colwellia chukchiensis TaxID=641665 RepID=A0A1H7JPV2_9GAMM|nr:hypothetical protein [Colwellia chukchiensis]SEK76649.1 hypothetical protein SAMN05216262_102315 [Colwellia chukchiensis]